MYSGCVSCCCCFRQEGKSQPFVPSCPTAEVGAHALSTYLYYRLQCVKKCICFSRNMWSSLLRYVEPWSYVTELQAEAEGEVFKKTSVDYRGRINWLQGQVVTKWDTQWEEAVSSLPHRRQSDCNAVKNERRAEPFKKFLVYFYQRYRCISFKNTNNMLIKRAKKSSAYLLMLLCRATMLYISAAYSAIYFY